MTFTDFASRMAPYWGLGALMGWAVWKSDYKDLLTFNLKSFTKFFLFMMLVTVYRFYMIRMLVQHGMGESLEVVKSLPVGATLFVGWEDLAHTAPLVLMRRMLGTKWFTLPIHFLATALVMISFASGHLYEGGVAAAFISLYILFGIHFGQKKGFGTLIAGHMTYNFLTIMTIRMALG